ncbi:MAG: YdcF family protein [Rhizobiales bacterium]|nr:YdcF family protein [Hyphomicrobiales bacterium]
MLVTGSESKQGNGRSPQLGSGSSRPLVLRLVRRLGLIFIVLPLTLLVIGFAWFIWYVPANEVKLNSNADGIVVLTGGASRITDAVELLSSGRGQRLLITGVHRTTSQREISRLLPEHDKILSCCVDLDRSAVNTEGNATETRRWVKDRGFRSLIVVTSNYHMPRAMAELAHQLPDVVLIPYPVVTEKQRTDTWWSSEATARLLISEYLKYVLAQFRMRFDSSAVAGGAMSRLYSSAKNSREIIVLASCIVS